MSLRSWVELFGETIIVDKEVSPELEAGRILAANRTTPVFFEKLAGSRAIGNLWSTRERICRALGVDSKTLMDNLIRAIESPSDPEKIDHAPVMEKRTEQFNLKELPIPKYYAADAGRYLTSAVVIAEQDGIRNLSFHRMMVLDHRRFAIRLVPRHLHAMHRRTVEDGEDLTIAVVIGLCPSVLLPAAMSIGFGADELRVANALRMLCLGERVQVTTVGNGVHVPANAEYVLEGRITSETVDEGPFVDVTGTIDKVRKQPIVEIDAVCSRENPIMQLVLSAGPEHRLLMGMPMEPVIMSAVRKIVPEVSGVNLTIGGCGWLHGVVSIEPQHGGDGKNAGLVALAAHTSMKSVVIVDSDIDVFDTERVEWAIATRFQPHRDLMIIEGVRGSSLDPSAGETTSKMVIDATIKSENRDAFRYMAE